MYIAVYSYVATYISFKVYYGHVSIVYSMQGLVTAVNGTLYFYICMITLQ